MAASAFAGTGVYDVTGVCSSFVKPGSHFTLNNSYTATVAGDQTISLHLSGTKIAGPFSQSEMQQLWQDVASIGL